MEFLPTVTVFVFATFSSGNTHFDTGFQEPPACSRFECEYKILERLIKLELERDGLIKEVRSLTEEVHGQSHIINKLANDVEGKSNTINELEYEVDRLKAVVKPTVAVKARLSSDVRLNINGRLVYNIIVSNEGNAYDPQSGIFRAPANATYIFSITACATNSDQIALNLIKDGATIIGQLRAGDDRCKDCNAEVTTAYLTAGSTIWVVRADHSNDRTTKGLQETVYWNSFTATLVN